MAKLPGALIDFTHFKGPPGNSRPSSSRMLNFGSVVDAAMVKKNGGKKKTVMSGDEVQGYSTQVDVTRRLLDQV